MARGRRDAPKVNTISERIPRVLALLTHASRLLLHNHNGAMDFFGQPLHQAAAAIYFRRYRLQQHEHDIKPRVTV